jgi:diguanylate cyclase (GGDEF)-like protein
MLSKLRFIDPTLPNSVAQRLELMLYTEPVSHAVYVIGLGVVAIAVWLRTGEVPLTSVAIALFLLSMLRIGFVKLYRSAPFYLPVLLGFGIVFASLLDFLVIRAFSVGDAIVIASAVLSASAYLSGLTVRAAAVPLLAITHASVLFAPLLLAAAVVHGPEYWAVAIMLTCHWLGSLYLIHIIHGRIRSQLLAEERITRVALTDALTGLANRAAFDDALAERLASAPAIIAMIDLDRFKPVNDTYGHDTGDELLKSVATRIVTELDNRHLVARLGGDEFAILFDTTLDSADATRVAEGIVRVLQAPFVIASTNITISASIGMAAALDGINARALKRRADERLYNAKRGGRGRVSPGIAAAAAA